ncbi:unnamed protein product, partial [Rotaria sp. Silwood1]
MIIEIQALRTNFNDCYALLDSEINMFRDRYETCYYDFEQAIKYRETMSNRFKQILDQVHDLQLQVADLRKKADDEPRLSEDINKLKCKLETQKDEIEKYKRILETRRLVDNISLS